MLSSPSPRIYLSICVFYCSSMCATGHPQVNGLLPFAVIESLLNLTLAQLGNWSDTRNTSSTLMAHANPDNINNNHNTTITTSSDNATTAFTSISTTSSIPATTPTTTTSPTSQHPILTVVIMAEDHDRANPNPGVAHGRSFEPQVAAPAAPAAVAADADAAPLAGR